MMASHPPPGRSLPVFFFKGKGGIRFADVTGVQACALRIYLGEEPPLGGGETVDPARRDLVQHAVDFGLRGIALDAARRLGCVAGPCRAPRMDQHAGLGPAPEGALGSSPPPLADLQVEGARR